MVSDLRFLLRFLPLTRTGILSNAVQRAGFVPMFWSPNTVFNQLFDVSWTNYTHINRKCKRGIILVNIGKKAHHVNYESTKPQVEVIYLSFVSAIIN